MRYIITKNRGSVPLNGFYFNDLPVGNKFSFNAKSGDIEPNYSERNIIDFSRDCYTVFNSTEEAEDYIGRIKKSIEEERDRYEEALKGSTDRLLKTVSNLKVRKE